MYRPTKFDKNILSQPFGIIEWLITLLTILKENLNKVEVQTELLLLSYICVRVYQNE
jgi:hypothetical protein